MPISELYTVVHVYYYIDLQQDRQDIEKLRNTTNKIFLRLLILEKYSNVV